MKTLVLGFDGASPKLIDEWMDHLPNFQALKRNGAFGVTVPPVPAQTPVAWSTFMSGMNPGNHGIFSFAYRPKGSYERKIIRTEMLRSKTLWRILGEAGKRVGVINVPMCDVENIRGFIIPGFVSNKEGIPFPKSVKEKIERKFRVNRLLGDLEIETLNKVESDPDLFFERANYITDEMAEISLYLAQEEEWDFFMTVFMSLDRVQHFFWKNVDPTHPKYRLDSYTNFVKDLYVKADRIVGDFVRSVDEDTAVLVMSDHGFCPVCKEVMVNNYLEEAGFLKRKSDGIDLRNSKAVSYGYGDIWLNVRGREPNGLIEPIKEHDAIRNAVVNNLKKIKIDGEKPIKDVKKREDLYWGTYLTEAPDLTIIFNVEWQAARQPEIAERNKLGRYVNENPRWSGGHDGTHDSADVLGIIGILGSKTMREEELRVHLWDLAPTILDWMEVSIPPNMDGRPLRLRGLKRGHGF